VRYFHRTTLSPDEVLAQAKGILRDPPRAGRRGAAAAHLRGALGKVTITARPEGGHYTLVEVSTDQVGESELDRLAKRFLAEVHKQVEPSHQLREVLARHLAPYPAFATAAMS